MKQVKRTKRPHTSRDDIRQNTGRRRRKRKKRKYMLYYILYLIILISVGVTLSMTVFFDITGFVVNDSGIYTQEEIILQSGVQTGENLVRCNTSRAEESILNSCIYLDEVDVSRKFPSILEISCVPAQTAYNLQQTDGSYAYISLNGRVLEVSQPAPADGAIMITGTQIDDSTIQQGNFLKINENDISYQLKTVKTIIESTEISDITSVQITSENSVILEYQSRIKIEIDDLSQAEYILNASKTIIPEYIGAYEHGTLFYEEVDRSIHFLPDIAG